MQRLSLAIITYFYCKCFQMKKLIFLCPIFFSLLTLADVTLPKFFGDNMVLQRNKPIPVWGWADPNEKVTVRFDKQVKTAFADKDGNWKVYLDKEIAGGPFILSV